MKNFLSVVLMAGLAAAGVSCQNQNVNDHGIFLADLDTTVRPGDNFFHFAGGGWIKANAIPAEQTRWGTTR